MHSFTISARQRDLHVATELGAVLFLAPLLAYVALTEDELPTWTRVALGGAAVATVLIDGGLLLAWLRAQPTDHRP